MPWRLQTSDKMIRHEKQLVMISNAKSKLLIRSKKFNISIFKLPKAHFIKCGLVKQMLERNLEH